MIQLFVVIVAIIWIVGAIVRIYQQTHYYQIEEYMSQRYIQWLSKERGRWLPARAIIAFGISIVFILTTDNLPDGDNVLSLVIALIASIIACLPAHKSEVKKPFVRTQRATRMLITAFATVAIIGLFGLTQIDLNGRSGIVLVHSFGFIIFWLAPLWLVWGNIAMTPVERTLRWRFEQRARTIMAEIRPKVIGITGSYGKTTTKNYVRDLLNIRYKAYATPKSYNTLMGLCIAINRDVKDDYSLDYFVAEMGMYGIGEIAKLCQFTPPDISLVIEVGPQHLERAGSIENIARAKYEIIEGTSPNGVGIFNWDNTYIQEMIARNYPKTQISVSKAIDPTTVQNRHPRFIATNIEETIQGLAFTVYDTQTSEDVRFETNINGEHNVTNLLMATAVAVTEGIPLREIARRVKTLSPAESRLETQAVGGITIINDAYSANPVGARSALQVLGLHQTGRRVLITPGMVELGERHYEENYRLGITATQYATDIILIGEKQTQPILDGIRSTEFDDGKLQVFEDLSQAIIWYQANLGVGDTILFLNDLPDTY